MIGTVEAIHVAPESEAEPEPVGRVEADVTLPPGAHRRTVTTAGIALDHLVGDRFRVGGGVDRV